MTYRDILVLVNEKPVSRPRAAAAAELADRVGDTEAAARP